MTQHFTRNTVSASKHCSKCGRETQHRVDDRRIGPCLECIARLTVQSAELEIERRREARQGSLFGERTA